MNLVWKLLRQHISISQFAGFAFANLFGMLIVLFGFQFYQDVLPGLKSSTPVSVLKLQLLCLPLPLMPANGFS